MLLLVVASLLRPVSQPAALLALCIAIGYLFAAAFPCDRGSPSTGSARQTVHNLGGAVEYIGGGIALLRLSETLGEPFRLAGVAVLGGAVALSIPAIAVVRGLIQRAVEGVALRRVALAVWLSRAD